MNPLLDIILDTSYPNSVQRHKTICPLLLILKPKEATHHDPR